ncbi:MAG TPA: hypothetical protein VGD71_42255 [Kribbella sp.]
MTLVISSVATIATHHRHRVRPGNRVVNSAASCSPGSATSAVRRATHRSTSAGSWLRAVK